MPPYLNLTPTLTADGSLSFFSTEYGEAFHSQYGARQEAEAKFVQPTQLAEKAGRVASDEMVTLIPVRILDICYGLGYNTAAALETIWRVNPNCRVELIALDLDPEIANAAIAADGFLQPWSSPVQTVLQTLAQAYSVKTPTLQAQLLLGDARQTLQALITESSISACDRRSGFDAIFLDPFSPPRCPQLWTVEFLSRVAGCLKPDGRLATYSCAAAIRSALIMAGLQIGATPPVGRRSPGTVASPIAIGLPPLSQQEQEHLHTRAAIPYRDPTLADTAAAILQRRQQEQQASPKEPTSQWKKRWLNSASGGYP